MLEGKELEEKLFEHYGKITIEFDKKREIQNVVYGKNDFVNDDTHFIMELTKVDKL